MIFRVTLSRVAEIPAAKRGSIDEGACQPLWRKPIAWTWRRATALNRQVATSNAVRSKGGHARWRASAGSQIGISSAGEPRPRHLFRVETDNRRVAPGEQ